MKSVTSIVNRSSISQTCHQHIWSATSVTNIDVTEKLKRTLERNSNNPGSLDGKGRSIARSSDDESPKPESYELFPSFDLVLIPLSVVIISSDGTFQYSSEDCSDIGSIVLKWYFRSFRHPRHNRRTIIVPSGDVWCLNVF